MKKWGNWILPGFLLAIMVGTGYWGYQESLARQNLQNRAESQYQRSYYELSWHMDKISGQMAQLMATSSKEQRVIGLASIWRQAFAAQANIGGLPLALVPLSKTEKFLSDTATVSYGLLSKSALTEKGLEDKDLDMIIDMYDRSEVLQKDLAQLGADILDKGLSWTEVELAATQDGGELEDNTIVNGFQLLEKRMEEYPEVNLGEDFSQVKPDVKQIKGNQDISAQAAEDIAQKWWFAKAGTYNGQVAYEGDGDIPTFGLEFSPPDTAEDETNPIYIDVSKLDGTVIWAMNPKNINDVTLSLSDGERQSKEFLDKHGFANMVLVEVDQEDNSGLFTFVPRQGEVLLYPDQVKVQVALDDGEVIGYEGTPYYMYHKRRELSSPTISEDQLRKQISPHLKVELIRPALIANTWNKEVLAWEVRGSYKDEKFVIFYNAKTGSEEAVTRITPPPQFEFDLAG